MSILSLARSFVVEKLAIKSGFLSVIDPKNSS